MRRIMCVVALYCASTHTLEASWSTPIAISSTPSDLADLRLDLSGNAIAVWQGFDGSNYVIQSAVLPTGGEWSAPDTISDPGEDAQSPKVCTDKFGNAVATWSRFDGLNSIIQSSKKPFLGSWSPSVNLSLLGQNAYSPKLSMDFSGDVGNAIAVWHRFNGVNFVIQASTLPSQGNWSEPETLSIPISDENDLCPEVAIDRLGNAIVCYGQCQDNAEAISDTFTVHIASKVHGQTWNPAYIFSGCCKPINVHKIAIDPSGNAILIWNKCDEINYLIYSSYLAFGGTYSPAMQLSEIGQDAFEPQVVIDSYGNATVAWFRHNGSNYVAQATTLPNGGVWSTPVTLSDPGQDVTNIHLAVDGSGNVLSVWDKTDGVQSVVQVATLPFGGSWSQATTLSSSGQNASNPVVGIAAGNAVVIWLESEGSHHVVKASTTAFEN